MLLHRPGDMPRPPQDEYATISFVPEACLRRMDSLRPEGGAVLFLSLHAIGIGSYCGFTGHSGSSASAAPIWHLSPLKIDRIAIRTVGLGEGRVAWQALC